MIVDYKPKFDELKKTMEGLFVSRGYKLEMRYNTDRRRLHRCEMTISGSSKKVANAYCLIRFQIDTMTIIYATGNITICKWLAHRYFKLPWYNMFDMMTASYH